MNTTTRPVGRPVGLRATTVSQNGRSQNTIRILLVDDHAVIRQALRMLLENQAELEVVADVENGREAVQAVEKLQPDVVLMDVVMPGLNGLEATRQIRRSCPGTRVVMLSGFVDEDQLLDSIRSGASGYINGVSGAVRVARTGHAVERCEPAAGVVGAPHDEDEMDRQAVCRCAIPTVAPRCTKAPQPVNPHKRCTRHRSPS